MHPVEIDVKRAVNKFEAPCAPIQQPAHGMQKGMKREIAETGEGAGKAECAAVRAAPGCFHINNSMGNILFRIEGIGICQKGKIGWRGIDNLVWRNMSLQKSVHEGEKSLFTLATDDVVGKGRNRRARRVAGHFRAAADQYGFRADGADDSGNGSGDFDIPDVQAQPDQPGLSRKNGFRNFVSGLLQGEFEELCVFLVTPQMRLQPSQPESNMGIVCIDSGKHYGSGVRQASLCLGGRYGQGKMNAFLILGNSYSHGSSEAE